MLAPSPALPPPASTPPSHHRMLLWLPRIPLVLRHPNILHPSRISNDLAPQHSSVLRALHHPPLPDQSSNADNSRPKHDPERKPRPPKDHAAHVVDDSEDTDHQRSSSDDAGDVS